MSVLVVDVGNTRTHFGVAVGGTVSATATVATAEIAALERAAPAFVEAVRKAAPQAAAFVSVRPAADDALRKFVRRLTRLTPVRLGVDRPIPIANRTDEPEMVGHDRLVNALAAHARTGGACVVVDAGSSVTVDVVAADGAFLGGAIAPGVGLQAQILHDRCAQLPLVDAAVPDRAIGGNTVSAMQSGLHWGAVGAAQRIVAAVRAEAPAPHALVLTGGDAARLAPHLPGAFLAPTLTLEGVALACGRL